MDAMTNNKRKEARFAVIFKVIIANKESSFPAFAEDISRNGMRVAMRHPFDIDQQQTLIFSLGDGKKEPIVSTASPRWIAPLAGDREGLFCAGFEFDKMSIFDQAHLEHFLTRFEMED